MIVSTAVNHNLLLDPLTPGGGGGNINVAAPSGSGGTPQLAKIPLDETNHNVESDTPVVDKATAFDINDLSAPTPKAPDNKRVLPERPAKPLQTPNKEEVEVDDAPKILDEASEEDDGEVEEEEDKPTKKKEINVEEEETEEEAKEQTPPEKKSRDYSGLDAEDVKVLKGTKNDFFNKTIPIIRKYLNKAKEGEAAQAKVAELNKLLTDRGTPPAWHDHPEAFILTPEYKQYQERYDLLTAERGFYEQQLVNIKSGKPFCYVKGYDAQGNAVLTAPIQPSNEDEVKLLGLIQRYSSEEAGVSNKVAGLQATFKQTHTAAATGVRQQMDKILDGLIPELKPTDEERKIFLGAMPATFKEHPLTSVMSDMYGLIVRQARLIQDFKSKIATENKIQNDVREAGPNTRTVSRNGVPANGSDRNGTVKLKNGKTVPAFFDMKDYSGDD